MADSVTRGARDGQLVSIVIPVYRNGASLAELHRRLCAVSATMPDEVEIIFVDDACPENSFTIIQQIAQIDKRVKAISLARNLGQQRAIMLGLQYARGECAVIMDADLQDPPEAIPYLLEKLAQGCEAAFAGRRGQYQPRLRMLTSRLFKRLIHLLTGLPPDAGIYVAMTRKMVTALLEMRESQPYVVGMIGCTGLALASVPVVRSIRPTGESAYSSLDRLRMGLTAVFRILILKIRRRGRVISKWPYDAPVKTYLGINGPGLDGQICDLNARQAPTNEHASQS